MCKKCYKNSFFTLSDCVKNIKIVPFFTSFVLKCLNFARILENVAQSCDFTTTVFRSSVWIPHSRLGRAFSYGRCCPFQLRTVFVWILAGFLLPLLQSVFLSQPSPHYTIHTTQYKPSQHYTIHNTQYIRFTTDFTLCTAHCSLHTAHCCIDLHSAALPELPLFCCWLTEKAAVVTVAVL